MVSIGQHNQYNKRYTNDPSDNTAFKKSPFHKLGKTQHYGSPQMDSHQTRPELSNGLIVIGTVEMELEKEHQTATQDKDQQNVMVVGAAHKGKANDHDYHIAQHLKVGPGLGHSCRHIGA